MADKAGAASRRGAEDVATSSQRMKLQSDYSQAMMWSKGFAAEETKAAFARAAELAGEDRRLLRAFHGVARSMGCGVHRRRIAFRTRAGHDALARSGGRGTDQGSRHRAIGLLGLICLLARRFC